MSGKRIVLLVVGSLLALVGLGAALGGGALLWAHQTQRDADGYFTTSSERFGTRSFAVTSPDIDLGARPGGSGWATDLEDLARIRLIARSADPGREVFVGIGPDLEVREYLRRVAHDEVADVDFSPFRVRYESHPGTRAPAPPVSQPFWAATAQGSGRQALEWDLREGHWQLVVMNADGSRAVGADIELGVRVDLLGRVAIGLLIGGLVVLAVGATMIVLGARDAHDGGDGGIAAAAGASTMGAVGSAGPTLSPVRVEGTLSPDLSRWLWLVKWLLAIPHYVVLAFLWIAFVVLSIVAWVAILATGRYPRGIFDFNVGVMRWSWRVAFYSHSALATDRYPPFTLGPADYPATLEVAYPEHLSRGLALVKTWLLAIPHYLVVCVFGAGVWWSGAWAGSGGWDDWGWGGWGGGLIGILVLIAGIVLLVKGRYPRGVFDLVMGINRWTYRVLAYAALMRDEYPPFRLDSGGREPAAPVAGPPPGADR